MADPAARRFSHSSHGPQDSIAQVAAISFPTAQKPKLLDQVRQAIRTRHYSPRTEETYVHWIKRFIFFHNKRHPVEMGESEIAQFLSSLASESHVSASTQNQALNAILFLYRHVLRKDIGYVDGVVRANRPKRLPTVLTRQEMRSILGFLDGVEWIMGMLLYGAGLRLMECLCLRVNDIDFFKNQVLVRAGKGDKDRYTMLPSAIADRDRLWVVREMGRRNRRCLAARRLLTSWGSRWILQPIQISSVEPS